MHHSDASYDDNVTTERRTYNLQVTLHGTEDSLPSAKGLIEGLYYGLPEEWHSLQGDDGFYIASMATEETD